MEDSIYLEGLAGVTVHCVEQARKRIPFTRDLPYADAKDLLESAIVLGITRGDIFPNPMDLSQFVVFAEIHGRSLWIVLGENQTARPGAWIAVTVLLHKDKNGFEKIKPQSQNSGGHSPEDAELS